MKHMTKQKVLEELLDLAKQLGRAPTHRDLLNAGKSNVRNVMFYNRWKISDLCNELGLNYLRNVRGVWTEEKILEELKSLVEDHGFIPNLDKIGKHYLKQMIYRSGHNIKYFQNIFDLKAKVDWTEEKVIEELKKESNKHGKFPTVVILEKNKRKDIVRAIQRSGKSIHEYAKILGYNPSQKPKGYWNDIDNIINEIKQSFPKLILQGKFPTQHMLVAEIGASITRGIMNCGGTAAIAELMGCKPNLHVASDGHYVNSSFEFILDEFLWSRGIAHAVGGKVGDTNYRYDFKVGEHYIEIWGYESERTNSKRCVKYAKKRIIKERVYKNNKFSLISFDPDYFNKSLEQIEKELEEKFSSLGFDITKKEKNYNINNVMKHCHYWNHDSIIETAVDIVTQHGKIPSRDKLIKLGYGGFADAAKRQFGLVNLRKLICKRF